MTTTTLVTYRLWRIDRWGIVHWPGRKGYTYCRRPVAGMQLVQNGGHELTCEACRDLYQITGQRVGV